MPRIAPSVISLLIVAVSLCARAQSRRTLLDDDWQFLLYASPDSIHSLPCDGWRTLSLPHDWSVEPDAARQADPDGAVGPFTRTSVSGDATGFTVGGEGWYRKRLPQCADNHLRTLYFEGAYNQADVWVNGQHAAFNPYGYGSFRVSLLPWADADTLDILVRVRNQGKNTRWYAGSGIYRHVWLLTTSAVHLDEWTTYVRGDAGADPTVLTTIHNDDTADARALLAVTLFDPDGRSVATAHTETSVPAAGEAEITLPLDVPSPVLWSPDSPALYTAVLTLQAGGCNDELRIPLGFRTLSVDAEHGFLLNGQPTLLRGGCIHHDNGLLGAAAYDRAETRKLALLKAQGYNAVRCAHNPPSEHFLHVCDSIGLMVIDEAFDHWLRAKTPEDYHRFFPTWGDRDLSTLVRRDRNHPSVILWSIGNEVPGRIEPEGIAAAAHMRDIILALDPTRPVNAAICSWDDYPHTWDDHSRIAFQSLDVGGYNYLYGKYESDHAAYPERVMIGTESYPREAAASWLSVERLPYVIGDFVWTAMDYLGEAGIGSAAFRTEGGQRFFQEWPWFNGWCGDIDLIGQKKPQSYFRDVLWRRTPIAMAVEEPCPAGYHMAVSAWGWPLEHPFLPPTATEADSLRVNVYSRAARVRLYADGQPLHEANPSPTTFTATYTVSGTVRALRAVNVAADGQETDACEISAPGPRAALRLVPDREEIVADGRDLLYVTIELTDADGRTIASETGRTVRISVDGPGILLAVGNASPTDQRSFRSPSPALFEGRALAIVQSARQAGDITLRVESDGLPTATLTIPTR